MTPQRAFIACGSNIDPRANLARALARLDAVAERLCTSSWYRTRPWPDKQGGGVKQDPYLNLVVGVRTAAAPHALLDELQAIEAALGRRRTVRYGPRTIDLDILLYGEQMIGDDRLTVPHPGLSERDFMLIPLLEIAPELTDPRSGEPLVTRRHQVRYRTIVSRVTP